jgi:hypothetical protein
MKYFTQLLCGVVLSSTLISAAISAEATVASSIEGTVVSSLNTDSYTYVEIPKILDCRSFGRRQTRQPGQI